MTSEEAICFIVCFQVLLLHRTPLGGYHLLDPPCLTLLYFLEIYRLHLFKVTLYLSNILSIDVFPFPRSKTFKMHDDSSKILIHGSDSLAPVVNPRVPCALAGFNTEIPSVFAIVCSSLDHLGDLLILQCMRGVLLNNMHVI